MRRNTREAIELRWIGCGHVNLSEEIMRNHTKLRALELADEVAVLIYWATRGFFKEIYGLNLVWPVEKFCMITIIDRIGIRKTSTTACGSFYCRLS